MWHVSDGVTRDARLVTAWPHAPTSLTFPCPQARSAGTESSGNQLYSGGSGPTPPPALSTAVVGMRKGGKRAVLVPPELSYPKASGCWCCDAVTHCSTHLCCIPASSLHTVAQGMMEIPASSSCELVVELLEVL